MRGHQPISDAGLLLGSIFVAVSVVGIGTLGGDQGSERTAMAWDQSMLAAATTPQKCTDANTVKVGLETKCYPGCLYKITVGIFGGKGLDAQYVGDKAPHGEIVYTSAFGGSNKPIPCGTGSAPISLNQALVSGGVNDLNSIGAGGLNSVIERPPLTSSVSGTIVPTSGIQSGLNANYAPGAVQQSPLGELGPAAQGTAPNSISPVGNDAPTPLNGTALPGPKPSVPPPATVGTINPDINPNGGSAFEGQYTADNPGSTNPPAPSASMPSAVLPAPPSTNAVGPPSDTTSSDVPPAAFGSANQSSPAPLPPVGQPEPWIYGSDASIGNPLAVAPPAFQELTTPGTSGLAPATAPVGTASEIPSGPGLNEQRISSPNASPLATEPTAAQPVAEPVAEPPVNFRSILNEPILDYAPGGKAVPPIDFTKILNEPLSNYGPVGEAANPPSTAEPVKPPAPASVEPPAANDNAPVKTQAAGNNGGWTGSGRGGGAAGGGMKSLACMAGGRGMRDPFACPTVLQIM